MAVKLGDKVIWQYRHQIGRKYSSKKTKIGVVVEILRPTHAEPTEAKVHFEGNKNPSKVKIKDLK